jgi:uncharacterized damage-inducible protein DinB
VLADDIVVLLTRELDGFSREIALFPDDESIWRALPGVRNPAGNIALHVAGNLRHFIGTVLGDTGWVRDRDAELSRRDGTRQDVCAELEDAARVVRAVLGRLTPADMELPMPSAPTPGETPIGRFLMHLTVHAGYHLGQVGYLRRILTGDAQTSGAMGLAPLAGRRQDG